ncbi:CPCC family cysteine-rich protein [uncultured Leifsonia sp.]|uniref:CPCC family cysteine-rich protein n=1 Tax=uncultured Leifsonia sp. TaxID=340359 RepID=UPI0037DC2E72
MTFPCPCCGYLTLDDPRNGSYEICPVCFWENDAVQNDDPSFAGGANEPSLTRARANFRRFGAVEERLVPHVRPARPDETPLGGR